MLEEQPQVQAVNTAAQNIDETVANKAGSMEDLLSSGAKPNEHYTWWHSDLHRNGDEHRRCSCSASTRSRLDSVDF